MILLQIYIGPSRATVLQNRDVVKELQVGMLVAVSGQVFPKIGKVVHIPPNPGQDADITTHWLVQERAAHKPKWARFLKFQQKRMQWELLKLVIFCYTDLNLLQKELSRKSLGNIYRRFY